MAEALVEFDYKAQEADELTIKKGDIITDINFKTGGWWEGILTRTGKRGMFPENFVKLTTDAEGETVHHTNPTRRCKVLFNYKPAVEDELELQVGDIIEVMSEVEEGWWRGKLKNKTGVFPSNFVAEITEKNDVREASQRRLKYNRDDSSKQSTGHSQEHSSLRSESSASKTSTTSNNDTPDLPMLPPKPIKEVCRVMYYYEAANADELTLHEGDIITIITKEGQDPGWWKGEIKGKIGVFPDNFVQIFTSPDEIKPDRPSKSVTTSRLRDHITKSATTSNIGGIGGISRKFSEPTKPPLSVTVDEKSTHTHPSVGKKPVLPPPPMKKPQRSSSDLSKSPTAPSLLSSKLLETTSTSGGIQMSNSNTTRTMSSSVSSNSSLSTVETTNSSSVNSVGRWSVLHDSSSTSGSAHTGSTVVNNATSATTEKVSDKTDGLLWSKYRSSYVVNSSTVLTSSESSSVLVSNSRGDSVAGAASSQSPNNELDLDVVGRAAMLTHPTANRAKLPKRRPPSAVINKDMSLSMDSNFELSLDNESKSDETSSANLGGNNDEIDPNLLINGDAESHMVESILTHSRTSLTKTAPWVEELKLSQAKKSLQAGKTRVMIGGPSPTDSATPSLTESSVTTTAKSQQQTITATTSSSSSSSSSMMSSSLVGAVTLRSSSTSGQQRPQSMVGSLRSSIGLSDSLLASTSTTTSNTITANSSSGSPQDTVTVTLRQWTELNDKLSRLELYFESQISTLTKAVKDLNNKLDEEKQRRQIMQQELEKLTDLVTQV